MKTWKINKPLSLIVENVDETIIDGNNSQNYRVPISIGKITVNGNTDSWTASAMKGGIIKIKGGAGPFLDFHMINDTIYVEKGMRNSGGCSNELAAKSSLMAF